MVGLSLKDIFFYFITFYMEYYVTIIWVIVVELINVNSFFGSRINLHLFKIIVMHVTNVLFFWWIFATLQ
jgi:hypothetical protein